MRGLRRRRGARGRRDLPLVSSLVLVPCTTNIAHHTPRHLFACPFDARSLVTVLYLVLYLPRSEQQKRGMRPSRLVTNYIRSTAGLQLFHMRRTC